MLPLLFVVALEIRTTGTCPAAADVERQLGPLLADGASARDVATIEPRADGAVSLAIADADGQPIGARTLPRARSCDDQAKAVAVTLAVLEAELHPRVSLGLDRLAPEPAPPTIAVVRPTPPPENELALGAVALVDRAAGTWAPGGRLELSFGHSGSRWRARVAAGAVARHDLDVQPGQASWWRGVVQLGADVDVARARRWSVALGAGVLGGLVSVEGIGYSVDRSARSFDVGGEARARFCTRAGRTQLWLGAAVEGWARRQLLDLNGSTTGAALPRVSPVAAAGAEIFW
ncbi:MAG TPA: hypothetical protein VHJ20_13450 [Polyangia bacterium]|nr:hypothetical protein [Polyangia bacterium]